FRPESSEDRLPFHCLGGGGRGRGVVGARARLECGRIAGRGARPGRGGAPGPLRLPARLPRGRPGGRGGADASAAAGRRGRRRGVPGGAARRAGRGPARLGPDPSGGALVVADRDGGGRAGGVHRLRHRGRRLAGDLPAAPVLPGSARHRALRGLERLPLPPARGAAAAGAGALPGAGRRRRHRGLGPAPAAGLSRPGQPPGAVRQRTMVSTVIRSTAAPSWFTTSTAVRSTPRSGLERDRRFSSTSTRTRSVSPGRTGAVHRSSSTPGPPRLEAGER